MAPTHVDSSQIRHNLCTPTGTSTSQVDPVLNLFVMAGVGNGALETFRIPTIFITNKLKLTLFKLLQHERPSTETEFTVTTKVMAILVCNHLPLNCWMWFWIDWSSNIGILEEVFYTHSFQLSWKMSPNVENLRTFFRIWGGRCDKWHSISDFRTYFSQSARLHDPRQICIFRNALRVVFYKFRACVHIFRAVCTFRDAVRVVRGIRNAFGAALRLSDSTILLHFSEQISNQCLIY